jgi:predicted HAD superfamily Cof-like phosphohydrolase
LWGNDEPIKIKKRLELYLLYVTFGSMLILSISAFFVYKKIKRNKKSKRNAA